MFCPVCGNVIEDKATYCDHCNESLIDVEVKEAAFSEQVKPHPEEPPKTDQSEQQSWHRDTDYREKDFSMPVVDIRLADWFNEEWAKHQKDATTLSVFGVTLGLAIFVLGWSVLGAFALPGIYAGFLLVLMDYLRHQKPVDIGKMFQSGWQHFTNMLVLMIFGIILIPTGLVLFIVPGIILMSLFSIMGFLVVDKKVPFQNLVRIFLKFKRENLMGLLVPGVFWLMSSLLTSAVFSIPVIGKFAGLLVGSVLFVILSILHYKMYSEMFRDYPSS